MVILITKIRVPNSTFLVNYFSEMYIASPFEWHQVRGELCVSVLFCTTISLLCVPVLFSAIMSLIELASCIAS